VLDALPHAVLLLDRDGTVAASSPSAAALFGPPARLRIPAELPAAVLAGRSWAGELAGPSGPVAVHANPLRFDGVVAGALVSADDTGQEALRRQAAETAEQLQLALGAGNLGTWRWEIATGRVDWDATMERLYGLEPGSFDGRFETWLELRGEEAAGGALATLDRARATREPFSIESRAVWPDGSVHWLNGWGMVVQDETGAPVAAMGCTADITARKTLELEAARAAAEAADSAERERLQHARLAFLAGISDSALVAADPGAFMSAVTRAMVPTLGDGCLLFYLPEPGAAPQVAVAHSDPSAVSWMHQVLVGYASSPDAPAGVSAVLRGGQTEYLADAATVDSRLTSLITVPLRTKRGVLGAMQYLTGESGRRFSDDDLTLAEAAAGRVAESLDNIWLTQRQRHIAATLQSALLPPALPEIPGVGVAVRYWAAGVDTEVGGDFYDLFALGPDSWAVVIGDVCGTGPDAAAVTAITRHTIRAAAKHGAGHAGVLEWLNEAVLASNRDRFCTALFGTLDRVEGPDGPRWMFTAVAGGHPLPVIARAGGEVASHGRPGTLLGVFEQIRTTVWTVDLEPGDTIVLYTDGVTDLPAPHGLSPAAVEELVGCASAGGAQAADVAEALGRRLASIRPIEDRSDDIAIVVLHVE
jgi:serine phosphatase RsbU (regulator of sigma subunit)/PAS domain-containing protein